MGMDLIEIAMEIEDEFDLQIPDSVVPDMTTIGGTIEFVVAELNRRGDGSEVSGCASARSFYRLRVSLASRCGIPRHAVRLGSSIDQLMPARLRRVWPDVAADAGIRARRRPLFSRRLPEADSTVREVLINQARPGYRRSDGSVDEGAVADRIMAIVSEISGTPVERLSRESRYVKDLHLD